MNTSMDVLVQASHASETPLPRTQPLTFTRNFAWVMGFCVAALILAPLLIGWTASLFLN